MPRLCATSTTAGVMAVTKTSSKVGSDPLRKSIEMGAYYMFVFYATTTATIAGKAIRDFRLKLKE